MKKKYLNIALIYAIAAVICGVFYREFTKAMGFTGITMLSKVHGHLFMLGMFVYLIIAIVSVKTKLEEQKSFRIFMITYNIGLPLTAIMMVVRGITQILNSSLSAGTSAMISGIAGIGHTLVTIGIVCLLLTMKKIAED
jgi:small-conductance mechanosensitive channel